ncbi:hypothetical protein AHiyo4_45590 [Arthrobacter sp. Hiyo4]|nr:hypothetical protein AHiyo4_45590 [Arthrobacter sp. Hiyo4]
MTTLTPTAARKRDAVSTVGWVLVLPLVLAVGWP